MLHLAGQTRYAAAMLGAKGIKAARAVHLICACLWGGGAAAMLLVNLAVHPATGDELFARDLCMGVIDDFVIVPGALGCVLTGFVFGMWTKTGFVRQRWVVLKWVLTLSVITFGGLFVVPWLHRVAELSGELRMAALADPEYLRGRFIGLCAAMGYVALLAALVTLSVYRPRLSRGEPRKGPR